MTAKKPLKLNFKLGDIMRAAFGLAMVDGGFIIAIQIITFLLHYFGSNIQVGEQGIVGISKTAFLVAILGILNLSVIIYRVAGLSRGIKYSLATCYQHAFRRWPVIILLYLVGVVLLMAISFPILFVLSNILKVSDMSYKNLLTFSIFLIYPYAVLACIYVVDQEKNPIQAIFATLNIIKHKISIGLLMNISMFYALPSSFGSHMHAGRFGPYLELVDTLWFLFCHIIIIVVYAGATVASKMEEPKDKTTKVIIV